MMRPRSSSRERSTSASVTVTVVINSFHRTNELIPLQLQESLSCSINIMISQVFALMPLRLRILMSVGIVRTGKYSIQQMGVSKIL